MPFQGSFVKVNFCKEKVDSSQRFRFEFLQTVLSKMEKIDHHFKTIGLSYAGNLSTANICSLPAEADGITFEIFIVKVKT